MIPTFALDLSLSFALGASVVFFSRGSVAHEPVLRSSAFGAMLIIELLLFAPLGGYLLWRYPDWSYMYLAQAGDFGVSDGWLCLAYPLVGAVGFFLARELVRRNQAWGALVLALSALALALAILILGQEQVLHVGTTEAFRAGTSGLRPLEETALAWVLAAGTLAIGGGWGFALWRLRLFARSWFVDALTDGSEASEEAVPEPTQKRQRKRS